MTTRYWDDFNAGAVAEFGPRLVTRDEIVAFAREFDPQPMHMDEAAARAGPTGGLIASGWHTCSILMRLFADGVLAGSGSMGSPGIEEVRWLRPVRPDDRLTARVTTRATRASKSRSDLGFVSFFIEVLNQTGAVAMTMTTTLMFARRPA